MSDHGTFHWNELMTPDPEAAKSFYETTIGWTFDSVPMGDGIIYHVGMLGDRPVGGIVATNAPDQPEHWMSYLSVDDIDARCEKAKAAGATIVQEPFDVPGVGRIAMIQQPGGGMVGWMTPAPAT